MKEGEKMKVLKLTISMLLTVGIIGAFLYIAIVGSFNRNDLQDTSGLTPIIGHSHNIIQE